MSNNLNEQILLDIIAEIEAGKISITEIRKKYDISVYRYYKIVKEYEINTDSYRRGPRGPTGEKNTAFKRLLCGNPDESKVLPDSFDREAFITDSRNGMKILELMDKYKLTLYQIRELRKKLDLKRR